MVTQAAKTQIRWGIYLGEQLLATFVVEYENLPNLHPENEYDRALLAQHHLDLLSNMIELKTIEE